MKGVLAAIFALIVLWVIDASFNGGRYTIAVVRVMRPVLAQIGIQI